MRISAMRAMGCLVLAMPLLLASGCKTDGEPAAGCATNDECAATEYCELADLECSGRGECITLPGACFDVYDPVCGCDGHTYTNECTAAAAGINVASRGECPAGACADDAMCFPTDYCEKPVGECAGAGECQIVPSACPDLWDPVCGCDGSTYGNECEAAASRTNIASLGECTIECTSNDTCPDTDYCEKPVGECGATGECAMRAGACFDLYDPVCGCDGKTHTNECWAAKAGVNIAYPGACAPG